jgi:hypothetical protein
MVMGYMSIYRRPFIETSFQLHLSMCSPEHLKVITGSHYVQSGWFGTLDAQIKKNIRLCVSTLRYQQFILLTISQQMTMTMF